MLLPCSVYAGPVPTPSFSPVSSEKLLITMSDRMLVLESKITQLNERIESMRTGLDQLLSQQKVEATEVIAHPSEHSGIPVAAVSSYHDPETGFVHDDPVQTFRNALMLFRTEKYPESVLAFTGFLGKTPDHLLAGSAQFYIAEAYFKQKEYKLALQEYLQVLNSYDKSAHVSDALGRLEAIENILLKPQDAARHRQLLSSLFPQSPAASDERRVFALHSVEVNAHSSTSTPPTAPIQTITPVQEQSKEGL